MENALVYGDKHHCYFKEIGRFYIDQLGDTKRSVWMFEQATRPTEACVGPRTNAPTPRWGSAFSNHRIT